MGCSSVALTVAASLPSFTSVASFTGFARLLLKPETNALRLFRTEYHACEHSALEDVGRRRALDFPQSAIWGRLVCDRLRLRLGLVEEICLDVTAGRHATPDPVYRDETVALVLLENDLDLLRYRHALRLRNPARRFETVPLFAEQPPCRQGQPNPSAKSTTP